MLRWVALFFPLVDVIEIGFIYKALLSFNVDPYQIRLNEERLKGAGCFYRTWKLKCFCFISIVHLQPEITRRTI